MTAAECDCGVQLDAQGVCRSECGRCGECWACECCDTCGAFDHADCTCWDEVAA